MTSKDQLLQKQDTLSRRDFLKLSIWTFFVEEVLRRMPSLFQKAEGVKSPERKLQPTIRVLDFFDLEKTKQKFITSAFPPEFSEARAWKEMNVEDSSSPDNILQAVPKNDDHVRLLMLTHFIQQRSKHGEQVVSVLHAVSRFFHPRKAFEQPSTLSISDAITLGEVTYDELGNPSLQVMVDAKKIHALVAKLSDSIINMSIQLGVFSLTYELYKKQPKYPELARKMPSTVTIGDKTTYKDYQGNEISEVEYQRILQLSEEFEIVTSEPNDRRVTFADGYAGKHTYSNYALLNAIAGFHPEKMFVVAGGNPTYQRGLQLPDIRKVRTWLKTQGKLSENMIVVGFEGTESGFKAPTSLGADVYVSTEDLKAFGFSPASSYATPVITEIIQSIVSTGKATHAEIKAQLYQFTNEKSVWTGDEEITYRVLDLNKVERYLSLEQGKKE